MCWLGSHHNCHCMPNVLRHLASGQAITLPPQLLGLVGHPHPRAEQHGTIMATHLSQNGYGLKKVIFLEGST